MSEELPAGEPAAPGAGRVAPRIGPHPRRAVRAAGWAAIVAAGLTGGAYAGLAGLGHGAPPADPEVSPEVVDRAGALLRPFALKDGRWRLEARAKDVDPRFLAMLFAYEDKRFRDHGGADPRALARAALQALGAGRVVSGGSTLTMQVARLSDPPRPRTLGAKLRQVARAIAIERHRTKDEILALYLTLAPYGGNIEGVRAAALTYFGKEPRRLTLGEAALLVALPQAPEARRPDRNPDAARAARDRVLDRLSAQGALKADEVRLAKLEPVPRARLPLPQRAPHLAEQMVAERPALRRHALTLERDLQARLEDLVRERTAALGRGLSAALLVVDNASSEVRVYVGGADFADASRAGAVDLARAVRSPGSTLKPFIYALAFDDGIAHPETLIEDAPVRFGTWRPENFDLSYQGVLPVRKALQLSLNVPAVRLLEAVGPQRLATRIKETGARLELPEGAAPSLPMGLGGVGIRLTDLAMLYAALAHGGQALPLKLRAAGDAATPVRPPRALVGEVAAWYVASSLLGTPAPDNALGGRIAFKTGTSYGYRDAWAVGFDGRRTVAVWVGRPDGRPVADLTGRSAAAPLLFDAFARIVRTPAPLEAAPKGAVAAVNARLPLPQRRFGADPSAERFALVYPPDGARLETGGDGEGASDEGAGLAIKVEGGVLPLTVLADGRPVARSDDRRTLFWTPLGRGFVRLTVIDAAGHAASATVRVD
ncbi:penicillin-binding protein 1C [Xanthobacter sp. KR7-225]|uniref:penicillin-binding protein 1C n=1 Tax=Xanthobacter sp. KR7-225 TaxID=3156613 RepID=UPI0032B4CE22